MAVEQAITELRFASPQAVETLTANLEDEDLRVRNKAADLILKRTVREAVTVEVAGTATLLVKTPGQIVSERLAAMANRHAEIEEEQAGFPEPPRTGELAAPVVVPVPVTAVDADPADPENAEGGRDA